MSVWAWLAIGIGAFLGVALALGLAIAHILGRISQDVTDLLETEVWSAAPLTRAIEATQEIASTAPVGSREPLHRSD
jgi:hypothetical protein